MHNVKKLIVLAIFMAALHNTGMAQTKTGPVLNHMAYYVHDLQKSTDFYTKIIGLKQMPEPFKDGKHTWYKIGNQGQLHLISGAAADVKHDKNTHLCFSVASIEDFIARLEMNGIEYTNWKGDGKTPTKRVDGVLQIYLQDPDGYWLEINNDKI